MARLDGYYPPRNYPEVMTKVYPNHSKALRGGVFYAFWSKGEQLWDEDVNNGWEWCQWWVGRWAHRRRMPPAPYYSPGLTVTIQDRFQHPTADPPDVVRYTVPMLSLPLPPWEGVKVPAIAERVMSAWRGDRWWGVLAWHEYRDVIEISMFMSQIRKNKVVCTYTVEQPFKIHANSRSSRVRGWPDKNTPPFIVQKNGVDVGVAWKSKYSSGVTLDADTSFAAGDRLSLKAPDAGDGKLGVTVTFIAELL